MTEGAQAMTVEISNEDIAEVMSGHADRSTRLRVAMASMTDPSVRAKRELLARASRRRSQVREPSASFEVSGVSSAPNDFEARARELRHRLRRATTRLVADLPPVVAPNRAATPVPGLVLLRAYESLRQTLSLPNRARAWAADTTLWRIRRQSFALPDGVGVEVQQLPGPISGAAFRVIVDVPAIVAPSGPASDRSDPRWVQVIFDDNQALWIPLRSSGRGLWDGELSGTAIDRVLVYGELSPFQNAAISQVTI